MLRPHGIKYCYVPCSIVSMQFGNSERAGACVLALDKASNVHTVALGNANTLEQS